MRSEHETGLSGHYPSRWPLPGEDPREVLRGFVEAEQAGTRGGTGLLSSSRRRASRWLSTGSPLLAFSRMLSLIPVWLDSHAAISAR